TPIPPLGAPPSAAIALGQIALNTLVTWLFGPYGDVPTQTVADGVFYLTREGFENITSPADLVLYTNAIKNTLPTSIANGGLFNVPERFFAYPGYAPYGFTTIEAWQASSAPLTPPINAGEALYPEAYVVGTPSMYADLHAQ